MILAGDKDLNDLYVCEVVKPADHLTPNPLVRVVKVIRYPVQHAVMLPDVINENAPITEGTVCRLESFGEAGSQGEGLTYEESLRAAQESYLANAPPGEAEIVRRHMNHDFRKRRVLIRH